VTVIADPAVTAYSVAVEYPPAPPPPLKIAPPPPPATTSTSTAVTPVGAVQLLVPTVVNDVTTAVPATAAVEFTVLLKLTPPVPLVIVVAAARVTAPV